MSLDIKKIAAAKRSEEDGGVDLGTLSGNVRTHIGETENTMMFGDSRISMDSSGLGLVGPSLHIDVPLDRILFNGMFQLNPNLMLGIPSTMVTPMPVLIPSPGAAFKPLANMIKIVRGALLGV